MPLNLFQQNVKKKLRGNKTIDEVRLRRPKDSKVGRAELQHWVIKCQETQERFPMGAKGGAGMGWGFWGNWTEL